MPSTDKALALVRHELARLQKKDGGSRLRRLKGWHAQAIDMYCNGARFDDIARAVGKGEGAVRTLFKDPKARQIIDIRMMDLDMEFRGMYALVLDAIRNDLVGDDKSARAAAVDKWLRVHGKYRDEKKDKEALTAEDIVQRLLEQSAATGGKGVELRMSVSSPAEDPDLIDLEPTTVKTIDVDDAELVGPSFEDDDPVENF